jgi:predicted nucleic acid-binding protein
VARAKRYFLDTNVIGYAFDGDDARKQEIALHLLERHSTQLVVSTQVLIELYSTCIKLGKSPTEAMDAVQTTAGLAVVPADRSLILEAGASAERDGLSIFDAAIVAAASRAECDELLTEDAKIVGAAVPISVFNPFAD